MQIELKYSVVLLCNTAGVSTSSYYDYKKKPLLRNEEIDELILSIYNKSNKRFGYRMIKYILRNEYKLIVNHKKVYRIMKKLGIHSIIRKKRKVLKEKTYVKDDLLKRDFTALEPRKKYVTDITYIPTSRKMVYLCTIIDLFNNEPVSWTVSDQQDKALSLDTLTKLAKNTKLRGSIIHSDRGVHYTCKKYVTTLKELAVQQSMSRKGNCWDNACAESFFSHFKAETLRIMKNKIRSMNDVIHMIEEYMDYYIHYRPQKKLGGLSPSMFKNKHLQSC